MKMNIPTFKKDQYQQARGGHSRFLKIKCEGCDNVLALYQKDGPGGLRRMYLDRIWFPKLKKGKEFICPACKRIVGTFFTYKKEGRQAIRLYQDAVIKQIISVSDAAQYIDK